MLCFFSLSEAIYTCLLAVGVSALFLWVKWRNLFSESLDNIILFYLFIGRWDRMVL